MRFVESPSLTNESYIRNPGQESVLRVANLHSKALCSVVKCVSRISALESHTSFVLPLLHEILIERPCDLGCMSILD